MRGTCGEVHRRVGSEDLLLVAGQHFSPALENVVHRLHRAVLVESRAPARSDVDDCNDEFSRADVGRSDELVGQATVSLESLRLLTWYDLQGPAVVRKVRRAFGVSVSVRAGQGLKGVRQVRGAMVRVEVLAYTPTDFLEEKDVTIGRCRDLAEKYAVTWVDVVDPNERTLEELGTLFGCHPLALEDAQNRKLSPKVDEYEDMVFVVARAIVWAEEIDTDQLSLFVPRNSSSRSTVRRFRRSRTSASDSAREIPRC